MYLVQRIYNFLEEPVVLNGMETLEKDIQFLMLEDGLTYEDAYKELACYLTLQGYLDYQKIRGIPEFISKVIYTLKGPLMYIPVIK